MQSVEAFKALAKMGCGGQADWVTAKIFVLILHWHIMNKCWKFRKDIFIHLWLITEYTKNLLQQLAYC